MDRPHREGISALVVRILRHMGGEGQNGFGSRLWGLGRCGRIWGNDREIPFTKSTPVWIVYSWSMVSWRHGVSFSTTVAARVEAARAATAAMVVEDFILSLDDSMHSCSLGSYVDSSPIHKTRSFSRLVALGLVARGKEQHAVKNPERKSCTRSTQKQVQVEMKSTRDSAFKAEPALHHPSQPQPSLVQNSPHKQTPTRHDAPRQTTRASQRRSAAQRGNGMY